MKRSPESERYQLTLANVRYKLQQFEEALTIPLQTREADVIRAYCRHDLDDVGALSTLVDKLTKEPTDDACVFTLQGNFLLKQEKFQEAV